MNKSVTLDTDEMTEEQAKAEIERIKIEIQRLFDQMKRDREEGQIIAAHTNATLARINEGLKQMLAH
ncbi:MAG TPA: hypothetical protein VNA16_00305 [Abditibacteriaceae bacterium]|nr:hypothetical protein [Abditibacteriaceae bacterium]